MLVHKFEVLVLLVVSVISSSFGFEIEKSGLKVKPIIIDSKYYGVEATALFNIPIENIWKVLNDYESDSKYCNYTRESRVIEKNGSNVRVLKKMRFLLIPFTILLDFTIDDTKNTLSWVQVSGFFNKNIGYWQLSDEGNGRTTVKYHVEISHSLLTEKMAQNLLMKTIPEIISSIERRGSGQVQQ